MAGIVSRLAMPLSGRTASASATAVNDGIAYSYAIAGMQFLAAIDDQHPYTRGLAQMRKDQFDNTREPGEQSLLGWWLRSQSTFIGGEGLLYQDPDQVQVANLQNRHTIMYGHSVGLNPWTNGKLTLLRQTGLRISSATAGLVQGYNDGTDRYWYASGAALKSDDGTTSSAVTWGGAGTIVSLASDGTHYYAADATGVYTGTGAGAGALAWNTGSASTVVAWVKGRLMAAIGNKVYELVGGAPPVLPAAKFTHLNASFAFTAIAEGTNAIYAAGNAGSQGAIYKFVLDASGNVPTLASGGVLTAQLPLGETVLAMTTYLGAFVGIGTSRGFRVGQIDSNGDIVYGPLLISNSSGCAAVAAYDRFFFVGATAGIDSASGLYRVDLGQPVQDAGSDAGLRFAWTTDLQAHVTGAITSVTNFGNSNRMVFAATASGAYLEDATVLESTGYFQTGRIRYSTLEPKLFKFLTVRTPSTLAGSVTASIIDPGGATTSVITISEGGSATITNVALQAPASAAEWVQLQLNFARSAVSAATGPEVNGWQIKALPGSVRQRVFTVPLLVYDWEVDRNNAKYGREGRTLDRIEAFEGIVQAGNAVTFQDMRNDRSYLVLVDDFEFRQLAAPGAGASGYGGVLMVQMRTIADAITA